MYFWHLSSATGKRPAALHSDDEDFVVGVVVVEETAGVVEGTLVVVGFELDGGVVEPHL